ncbi:hypothetical protein [Synechococcus elongatus]|uniref:Uncharacterized protein n=2 Tax=Synechococcus elongatus TaxID=32046 RepID=A0AAN1QQ77_SYNEL|nr:hypothetical protein [Synechococcus elongatus]QFZ93177.1 hypothetical protein EKO22_13455 [Synechococcus elongatus PCC 11802]
MTASILLLSEGLLLAQAAGSNPLVSQRGEASIYIGLILLGILLSLLIGLVSRQFMRALYFSGALALILIAIVILL